MSKTKKSDPTALDPQHDETIIPKEERAGKRSIGYIREEISEF